MTLSSMTGFARREFEVGQDRFAWEIKSVNARNLELRLRLPTGLDFLEPDIRKTIRDHLTRGSVFLNLNQEKSVGSSAVRVNEDALAAIVGAAKRLVETETFVRPPDAAALLSIRGVLEDGSTERDEKQTEVLREHVLKSVGECLSALSAMRAEEGHRLGEALAGHLDAIKDQIARAEDLIADAQNILRERIAEQVASLVGESTLDPDRLHQEAVLLASKQDIREEIDRLKAHCAASRELLDGGGPVGRRLDFLAQEFNREANTLCSKAFDRRITAIGLDMKATIEQFREQVQNLE